MMEATNWAPEHSDALREFLGLGMSFSEIAKAINSRFKTTYSRKPRSAAPSGWGSAGQSGRNRYLR
jgi:hypothetical protein